jgi:thiol-disulfide isomerase/thioredoxin
MRFRSAILYAAIAAGAIYAATGLDLFTGKPGPHPPAGITDTAAPLPVGPHPLAEGLMKKLSFHAKPQPVSQKTFTDPAGGTHSLADYRGRYVLVNFWATWCAPCRKEMPSLDRLQAKLGSDRFSVEPIATGRNTLAGINRFFAKAGIENLPVLLDPKQQLARDSAVLGLPISIILDPQGREIARLRGDAEWDSDSAIAILSALLDQSPPAQGN